MQSILFFLDLNNFLILLLPLPLNIELSSLFQTLSGFLHEFLISPNYLISLGVHHLFLFIYITEILTLIGGSQLFLIYIEDILSHRVFPRPFGNNSGQSCSISCRNICCRCRRVLNIAFLTLGQQIFQYVAVLNEVILYRILFLGILKVNGSFFNRIQFFGLFVQPHSDFT